MTSGVEASVLLGLSAFFSLLMACYLFRLETMTREKLAGCLLGFAAVCIMYGLHFSSVTFTGNIMVVLSQFCVRRACCTSRVKVPRDTSYR